MTDREASVDQGGTPGASIRCGNYKLIEFYEDNRMELYDLVEDISEENDLAESMPDKVRELREKLDAWRDDVNALVPEPNPDFVPWQ